MDVFEFLRLDFFPPDLIVAELSNETYESNYQGKVQVDFKKRLLDDNFFETTFQV